MCFGRDLLDRLVAPQRLQGYPGLELARKPPSRRHLVSLRYPAEYTLSPCPIFQDQTDEAERQVFTILMHENPEAKILMVATSVADALEKAGDALLHTSRLVADHALGEWLAA